MPMRSTLELGVVDGDKYPMKYLTWLMSTYTEKQRGTCLGKMMSSIDVNNLFPSIVLTITIRAILSMVATELMCWS